MQKLVLIKIFNTVYYKATTNKLSSYLHHILRHVYLNMLLNIQAQDNQL